MATIDKCLKPFNRKLSESDDGVMPSNGVVNTTINTTPTSNNNNKINSNSTETMEINENFYLSSKNRNNVKIQVKLNSEGIYLRRQTEQDDHINEQLIRIEDIIGSYSGPRLRKRARGGLSSCRRLEGEDAQSKEQKKDSSAYLYVYAYIRKDKPLRRERTVRILRFRSYQNYEENLRAADGWHRAISLYKLRESQPTDIKMQQDKQLLILLNPKSGSGKGRELFQKQVAPVLKEADIPYELLVTTHANYARELVRKRKDLLQCYNGIVVAAGDGLFYEVLNGMMERADWRVVSRHLPIGVIPCGSGNGLAKSIAHLYNEPYDPKPILNATLTCVSGKSVPMDIVRVELAKGDKHTEMYSFLSVGWGLIADVDIESERLRSIGAQRFTLWSILRLITMRSYKGKLYYLPWRKEFSMEQTKITTQYKAEKQANEVPSNTLTKSTTDSSVNGFYDVVDDCSEYADAQSLHIDSWHSAASKRTAYYSIGGQSVRSRQSVAASLASKIEEANAEFLAQAPSSSIPPVNISLPSESWRCEEGAFVMVQAAYTTHLATDCYFAPGSRLNDGIIYLVIIRAGVGRTQLIQFLLGLSTGTHLPEEHNEFIQVLAVRAFRIEPEEGTDGIITVDGERVDYGCIQGEILPGMIKVMVPNVK